jgi:hypothetical protein
MRNSLQFARTVATGWNTKQLCVVDLSPVSNLDYQNDFVGFNRIDHTVITHSQASGAF